MDLDHQLRLVEFDAQLVPLASELCDVQRIDPRCGVHLGAAHLRCKRGQLGSFALASPGAQRRRVHALAAHQRADLTGLGAQVGGLQNATLVGVGERATPGTRNDLGIAAVRDHRRRRSGRIFSRPTGSLRCERIGRTLHCVHRDLRLWVDRHTYLFAH